jgi:hypothetical protein
MRIWRVLPGERSRLYSPIGLRLLDEMTGGPPIGRTEAFLDVQEGADWRSTAIRAVRTAGGMVAYPGLERRVDVAGPPRHYRVRITAELYRPLYLTSQEGIEFDAFPWNDTNPPASTAQEPQDVKLAPAPHYPFPSHVPVLRGAVIDAVTLDPVADAEVMYVNLERVLSDERGEFALPLRFAPLNVPVTIDALRGSLQGSINVTLPAALGKSQTISIS